MLTIVKLTHATVRDRVLSHSCTILICPMTGADPETLQGGWLVVLNYTDAWVAAWLAMVDHLLHYCMQKDK